MAPAVDFGPETRVGAAVVAVAEALAATTGHQHRQHGGTAAAAADIGAVAVAAEPAAASL